MFRDIDRKLWCRPKEPAGAGKTGRGSLAVGCFYSLVSTLCFVWSGFHMLTDEFPEMAAYSGGRIPLTGLSAISAVIVLLFTLPGRRFLPCRRIFLGAAPLLGAFTAWRIRAKYEEEILSGSLQAAGIVIAAVNRHYKFNFSLPEGQARYCPLAVLCIGGFLLAALLYAAYVFRRRWIVMGFPLSVLALGLLAGCAPGLSGVTECFIGLLFCRAGGWENVRAARGGVERGSRRIRLWAGHGLSLVILVLLAVLLPLGISARFSGAAEELAESGEGVVVIQRKMEEALELNIQQLSFTSEDTVKENINNRTPKYREQEILRVTLTEKPGRTLYFRGFYGGEYAGGGWNSNHDRLQEALAGQEWTEDEVAGWLIGRAGAMQEGAGEWKGFPGDCTLQFLRRGGTVYVPYFLAPEDSDSGLQYGGEYQIRKKKSLDTVQFGRGTKEQTDREDGMAEWYGAYVRGNYHTGSEAVPSAGRVAKELLDVYSGSRSMVLGAWSFESGSFGFQKAILKEDLDSADAEIQNQVRLHFAHAVSAYLGSGVYSRELNQVPDGTDVVEYFLSESKTGYCVHYASAGVLILQAMGIPARYASGYVAPASDFRSEAGQYVLSLKDSAAHAWAEIYLEDIGWVPVEMTPGYGDEQTDRNEEEMMALSPDLTLRRAPENGDEGKESGQAPDAGLSEASEESGLQTDGGLPGDTASPGGAEPSANRTKTDLPEPSGAGPSEGTVPSGLAGETVYAEGGKSSGLAPSVILAVIFLVGIAAAWILLPGLSVARKRRKLQLLLRDIRQGRNRQAVFRMNRSVYRRLKAKNRQWFARMSDGEYTQTLIRTFPDTAKEEWDAFIGIARKASFSQSEISDGEVQAVYEVYKKVN
ncbi:MAG TPA: hypothetical protein DF613_17575 [Lachnospiraceae bacterium]|nr:hypothetical protein [Lachnospiraceae bacterium]